MGGGGRRGGLAASHLVTLAASGKLSRQGRVRGQQGALQRVAWRPLSDIGRTLGMGRFHILSKPAGNGPPIGGHSGPRHSTLRSPVSLSLRPGVTVRIGRQLAHRLLARSCLMKCESGVSARLWCG